MTDNKTTAYWANDILMVHWYGGRADEAAWWLERRSRLVFDSYTDTKQGSFDTKPTADEALAVIINWQNDF